MQEQDKNTLYIFNGDCAYQAWQKVSGGSAEALVCRENLHAFSEIFRAFNAGEKYPFLGDTSCKLLLDTLVTQGHIVNTCTADMPYYAAPPNR